MPVTLPMIVVPIAMLAIVGRLWWVLRDRSRRRRAQSWDLWWNDYRQRLPAILMARWPKRLRLVHRRDTAA